MRRQFGAEYETYCRVVPRWIPRGATATEGVTPPDARAVNGAVAHLSQRRCPHANVRGAEPAHARNREDTA